MRIAVTGATGFVGWHVLKALLASGLEPVAAIHRTPLKGLDVETVPLVLEDADPFAKLGNPDAVIHLAWSGLPNYRSLHHFETELPRQFAFCRALVDGGLKQLVVAGTCQEYGMLSGALTEDMATQPHTPYAFAKDALRRELEFLAAQTDFRLVWARLFYMHGEGQPATSLYPQLKAAAEGGQAVFNMSGGQQLRDYLPVSEVAAALADLASAAQAQGIYNICSGKPVTVRSLVDGWIADHGWTIQINPGFYPYPTYEPMEFWGNRRRLDSVSRA